MKVFRAGAAALCIAAATAACSSGDTGSSGGWRVNGTHITISGAAPLDCPTQAPVLDTFSQTPTPNPACSPPARVGAGVQPSPTSSADADTTDTGWRQGVSSRYPGSGGSSSSDWRPIYTTYTAPPPPQDVYQPMVQSTTQPMPTPYVPYTNTATTAPSSAPGAAAPTPTP